MPSPEETKAMHDILLKLQAASEKEYSSEKTSSEKKTNSTPVPGNVSEDAVEMFNILNKLQEATSQAAQQVITESETRPELSTATYRDNSISVSGKYNIQMESKTVVPGIKKKFYHITDENNNPVYEDIALFESAMAIIKGLMINKSISVDRVVDLDNKYASQLSEAAIYKQKAKTLTESHRRDLALTKQSVAYDKMKQLKSQIKRFL